MKFFGGSKLRYKAVIVVNLRQDLSIDGDDTSYGPREMCFLGRPINMPGIAAKEIEVGDDTGRERVKER